MIFTKIRASKRRKNRFKGMRVKNEFKAMLFVVQVENSGTDVQVTSQFDGIIKGSVG